MSALLGASAFGCGVLPLSFVFSKSHLTRLSTVGTGLLLGTALGVIIPEGIEAVVTADSEVPTARIALSLLVGFIVMLLIEQTVSPHSHSHSGNDYSMRPVNQSVEFDAELGELEHEQGPQSAQSSQNRESGGEITSGSASEAHKRGWALTVGLILHACADGLALGVSFQGKESSSLSLIVFLAILVHKAPTALALTSSLLALSLPRPTCKMHLAMFCSATPLATVASYFALATLGIEDDDDWTGTALLFSGGTFLYVATVLQPIAENESGDMTKKSRLTLIVIGMFIPFLLGSLLGHEH